jgi:tRNA1(Val) A37 N6-methylase TrmN6
MHPCILFFHVSANPPFFSASEDPERLARDVTKTFHAVQRAVESLLSSKRKCLIHVLMPLIRKLEFH